MEQRLAIAAGVAAIGGASAQTGSAVPVSIGDGARVTHRGPVRQTPRQADFVSVVKCIAVTG